MPVVTLGTLLEIYDQIKKHPGITRNEISLTFGKEAHWCNEPKLIAVEAKIGLLSEDNDGKLFVFGKPHVYHGRR